MRTRLHRSSSIRAVLSTGLHHRATPCARVTPCTRLLRFIVCFTIKRGTFQFPRCRLSQTLGFFMCSVRDPQRLVRRTKDMMSSLSKSRQSCWHMCLLSDFLGFVSSKVSAPITQERLLPPLAFLSVKQHRQMSPASA